MLQLNIISIRLCSAAVFSAAALTALSLAGCRMAVSGHNMEGVRLYQQGQYQAAMQQFQQAVAADPMSADAYYNLGATFHRTGLADGDREALARAEGLYNQCLEYDPNHVDCYRSLAVLLVETGRSDRAFVLMKNWAVRSPQLADPRIELARLYQEFGDRPTAQIHLNEALQVDHQNPRAWAALGQLREETGDYRMAMENYQRSLNLNQFQPGLAARIADLRRAGAAGIDATPPGGTRTVDASNSTPRY